MKRTEEHPPAKDGDRIAKLLARAGVASRREIERMIEDRRIALNGVALETPATILKSLKGITVDGKPVAPPETARLFRYNKPTGLLVAERDFTGRPTIYDKLPKELPRVVPVGRLDLNTEGLLLLTNDGELKRQLELPSTGIPRTYRARTYGPISQAQLEDLIEGVEVEGVRYGSINANLERRTGTNQWIEMTLTEGKNREVRRVLEHLGLQVSRLIRTAYGPFPLADMPRGAVDEIKQNIVVEFTKNMKGMKTVSFEASVARPRSARTDSRPARTAFRPARTEALPPRTDPRPAGTDSQPARNDPRRTEIPRQKADMAKPSPRTPKAASPLSPRAARATNFGPKVARQSAAPAGTSPKTIPSAPKRKHWRDGPKVPPAPPRGGRPK